MFKKVFIFPCLKTTEASGERRGAAMSQDILSGHPEPLGVMPAVMGKEP